jgi:hypothetical protein
MSLQPNISVTTNNLVPNITIETSNLEVNLVISDASDFSENWKIDLADEDYIYDGIYLLD